MTNSYEVCVEMPQSVIIIFIVHKLLLQKCNLFYYTRICKCMAKCMHIAQPLQKDNKPEKKKFRQITIQIQSQWQI